VSWEEDEELKRLREAKLRELMRRLAERERRAKLEAVAKPVDLTDENFDNLVKRHELVVVDFWAPWCPPCQLMAPIIEELARQYAGQVVFAKLNVDENPLTAMRFDVRAVPTFLVFRRGRLVDRWVGAMPKQVLELRLKKLLGK